MSLPPGRIASAVCLALMMCPPAWGADPLPDGALARMDPDVARAGGPVLAIAFSPDGKSLASGSQDGTVRLWEAATGKELRRLMGHRKPVRAVAFSPDGRTLASAGEDHTVRLWDVAAGKPLRRLEGHSDAVLALAFSPDGSTLASAGGDRVVCLWRTADGKELRRLDGHRGPVHGLTFLPDGKTLVSAGKDRLIRFWDPATGTGLRLLKKPGWVLCVAVSGDGAAVACGGQDQLIHLYRAASGEILDQFGGYEGPVYSVALSFDARTAAAGTDDRRVRLWETATGKVRRQFTGHRGSVRSVAMSQGGLTVASGGEDAAIWVWDVTGRLRDGRLRPVDLSPRAQEALWLDLGSTDAGRAYQAVGKLIATPGEAVPALQKRLQPILERQVRIARLVADLDAEKFAVRHRATVELERIGELAVPALLEALQGGLPLETRLRLEQLVRKLHQGDEVGPFSQRLQLLRTIEVLEHVGSRPARQLLERLAAGLPAGWGRHEAKVSVDRLDKRVRR